MDQKQAEALKVLAVITARALEKSNKRGDHHESENHQGASKTLSTNQNQGIGTVYDD